METQQVAIYLDFENLAISAEEVYPSKDQPLQIEPVVDFASTKGNVCIKKAYADWSKDFFSQYQNILMEQGFELIHLPATNLQGKNGSDVRLAIDVMENLELFQTISTIIIGSGDTDFVPLIQRVRARGIKVISVGFDHSVGNLVKINSAEFKSLEELIGKPEEESLSTDLVQEKDITYGRELLMRYIRNRNEDEPIPLTTLKQDLLRLDPAFSEKKLGFSTFKKFIKSFEKDLVSRIEPTEKEGLLLVYFNDVDLPQNKPVNPREEIQSFLVKNIRFQRNQTKRLAISKILLEEFQENPEMTMSQMIDLTSEQMKNLAKVDIRKYINLLFSGKTFQQVERGQRRPLLFRPMKLKETANNPEVLEQMYLNRVREILKNRYTILSDEEIDDLLDLKRS
ncbi:MAG: NYN domain-containing protein [Firmicutes bacterium]|nr:NYN domain-containing protein [Bacillota bacterium]